MKRKNMGVIIGVVTIGTFITIVFACVAAVALDLDHIWGIVGLSEWFQLSSEVWKPFHSFLVVCFLALLLGGVCAAFTRRWIIKRR